ncbi:MAG TPA: hypothetical protein HA257_09195 [Candidatus Methanoperedenaceae archaeon]|nr:hypothetical protein [Candidatus Methanoperedenaceae archaeon]
MLTILNGRVDDFFYAVGGSQMDAAVEMAFGGDSVNSSVYQNAKKFIAGNELKHKTFSDIAAESAASQFVIYHGGYRVQLNFLTEEYRMHLNELMKSYLDDRLGARYRYNASVAWRPFVGVPVGGDATVGEPVPSTAYTESAYITIPSGTEFNRASLAGMIREEIANIESNLTIAKNSTLRAGVEANISADIHSALDKTIDYASGEIINATLYSIERKTSKVSQFDAMLPGGQGGLDSAVNESMSLSLSNDTSITTNGSLNERLVSYIRFIVKADMLLLTQDEIDALAADMVDRSVAGEDVDVENTVTSYVLSRVDVRRARLTLAIWERRV